MRCHRSRPTRRLRICYLALPLCAGQNDPVLSKESGRHERREVYLGFVLSAPGGRVLPTRLRRVIGQLLQKFANKFSESIPSIESQLSSLWYMLMISCNQAFLDPQAEEIVREVISAEVEYAVCD